MKRRFSAQELFELRNNIAIDQLIRRALNLPVKHSEGYFRFLCPVCREFQTGIKLSTNLARCFLCGQNYNTIDLVMLVKGTGFVESVDYLKELMGLKRPQVDSGLALQEMLSRMSNWEES